MRITSRPTSSEVIHVGKEESVVRFYYGDAHRDRTYKAKNGRMSILETLKFLKDFFSRAI